MKRHLLALTWVLGFFSLTALAADSQLIVVEDRGGDSALPYYQALGLPPREEARHPPVQGEVPAIPTQGFSEVDMLPVRSALLTPGTVGRREIQAPGLRPLFLVGDDERSHEWLRHRADTLLALGAVGLVVNIESPTGLTELRRLAPGLILSPVSADDLARRLHINHYPVLITATGIEQ
jgi:integrating conjugative element protein (TIGR03765 family)